MNQPWYCANCETEGALEIDPQADVYSVINLLRDDHEKRSPDCGASIYSMRVRTPMCSDEEWGSVKGVKS